MIGNDPNQPIYKYNHLEINSILQLFNIFDQQQYSTFISQQLIKENLSKEFDKIMKSQNKIQAEGNNLQTLKHINQIETVDAVENLEILRFFRAIIVFLEENV